MGFFRMSNQDFRHTKPRYSIQESMDILGCGRARIYEYIKDNLLEVYKVGGRTYATPEGINRVIEHDYKEAHK